MACVQRAAETELESRQQAPAGSASREGGQLDGLLSGLSLLSSPKIQPAEPESPSLHQGHQENTGLRRGQPGARQSRGENILATSYYFRTGVGECNRRSHCVLKKKKDLALGVTVHSLLCYYGSLDTDLASHIYLQPEELRSPLTHSSVSEPDV